MRKFILFIIVMCATVASNGQMLINGETLYGNEWIDYDRQYLKIALDETAIYKLTYDDLQNNGFPAQTTGSSLQLFNNGSQVAIYTSNEGILTPDDFILFYGKKNDGELDKFHFRTWERDQLNPYANMYTDVRTYYLTWDEASQNNARIVEIENDLSGSLPQKQNFYLHKEEQIHNNEHWGPKASVADIEYSSFVRTEGFGSGLKPIHTFEFDVTDIYDTAVKPRVDIRLGSNIAEHIIEFDVNGKILDTDVFNSLKVEDYSYSFDNSDLKGTTRLKLTGKGASDFFTVSYTALFYPRAFKANNSDEFVFQREGNSVNDYYEIEDFKAGTVNYAFDVENNTFLKPQVQGNKLRIHIPLGGANRSDLFIIAQRKLRQPLSMQLKSFTSVDDLNP